MKKMTAGIILTIATGSFLLPGCAGNKPSPTNLNSGTAANTAPPKDSKSTPPATTTSTAVSPSEIVKQIYEHATRRNCAAIPPMLTEDFRKAVGSTKDELDALCDTFTDSDKLISFEIAGEQITGDAATVKVSQTFKDGRNTEKEERVKKAEGKWLMDS